MTKPPRTPRLAQAQAPAKRDRADPKFARDLTRAEFGRFYWNDELAKEVQRACLARKKRPAK